MLPELFSVGGYPIYSFGVFVALAFIGGMWWCRREAIRRDYPMVKVLDLTFWIMIWGLVGARVGFIAVNWRDYAAHPEDLWRIWEGGLVWYGGFIGAFAATLLIIRRYGLPFWGTLDILGTALPFGHAIGRLGCLAAGDDHGRLIVSALGPKAQALYAQGVLFTGDGRLTRVAVDTIRSEGFEVPWYGLTLGPASLVQGDLIGMPIFASQVYMSAYNLAIFAFLVVFRRWQRFEGELAALYLIIYPICRFFLEYSRGDIGRGFWLPGISTSQGISLLVLALGLAMYGWLWRRRKQSTKPDFGDT